MNSTTSCTAAQPYKEQDLQPHVNPQSADCRKLNYDKLLKTAKLCSTMVDLCSLSTCHSVMDLSHTTALLSQKQKIKELKNKIFASIEKSAARLPVTSAFLTKVRNNSTVLDCLIAVASTPRDIAEAAARLDHFKQSADREIKILVMLRLGFLQPEPQK